MNLALVSDHHLIIVFQLLLHKVEGFLRNGLTDKAHIEAVVSVKLHEKAQCPKVVALVV